MSRRLPDSSDPQKKNRQRSLLSGREFEVLEMAARGLTNQQVADQLSVSVHAVKFHLASVYRKLGVANRTEAAVAYMRAGQEDLAAGEGAV